MAAAIELARNGLYSASPNPRVGCILAKGGRVIGRGYHRRAGAPHAELEALDAVEDDPAGATAYVSLEPCVHRGRTPPCTEALIAARVARVVFAVADPNPIVNGSGAARLRAAGVEVTSGVMAEEAERLNKGFFMRMRAQRPYVRVKVAMSLDGAATLATGESQWITGSAARADVQRLRAESCAVVTGIGTVLVDDPSLNVRDGDLDTLGRQPVRVVLDSKLRMPADARMLTLAGETLIAHSNAANTRVDALIRAGARVELMGEAGARIPIDRLLARLAELEINELLVEAGPTLAGQFVAQGCYDELIVYLAPKLLGAGARAAFALPALAKLADAAPLMIAGNARIGDDLKITLVPTG